MILLEILFLNEIMQKITTIKNLRNLVKSWRVAQEKIAFIPTMGNLHTGHLALVQEAKKHANRVVVSIFVNPMQFGANEDFSVYPRTEQQDCEQLKMLDVDAVFLPTVDEIYAKNAETVISVIQTAKAFCGKFRAGHFDGVATIVCKLFNIVQPDIAVFGQKDFQQLAIIRTMVDELNLPVEIIGVETMREANGLAMSSRNGYLSIEQKTQAALLYQTLLQTKQAILNKQPILEIQQNAIAFLERADFKVDYFEIAACNSKHWHQSLDTNQNLVILVAAKLGTTRLIDNLIVELNEAK